ncbi:hypothetical protein DL96DRAFT_602993 [Flagelloscypha sp. PMI_526]|nr:hypothetical protein DL96DRAFT_602993 [Flagelloscypha sp. PMI_526]
MNSSSPPPSTSHVLANAASVPFNRASSGYFDWSSSHLLTSFVFSVILGVFTLCGGGWWIKFRYTPRAKEAGAKPQLATVWVIWLFTILFFILTASWSAEIAHYLTVKFDAKSGRALYDQIRQIQDASVAFVNLSPAAWMIVLIVHTRVVRKKLAPVQGRARSSIIMFLPALGLLGCSIIFGGILLPARLGTSVIMNNGSRVTGSMIFRMVYAISLLLASLMLLYFVIIVRKTTHLRGQADPLRNLLFSALPAWIIVALDRVVVGALDIGRIGGDLPFDQTTLLFGIASLTTIWVLPATIVGAESEKLGA